MLLEKCQRKLNETEDSKLMADGRQTLEEIVGLLAGDGYKKKIMEISINGG